MILCLDTATPTARVAILDRDGRVLFSTEATAERHSSHVLPLIAEALRAVGTTPAALAAVACGGGPGSFTGLRVGMAVAKGLALPTRLPFHVVSSLEALALDIISTWNPQGVPDLPRWNPPSQARRVPTRSSAPLEVTAVPCLDAGKGEVHVAGFVADPAALVRETVGACRLPAAELPGWLAQVPGPRVAGNGAERHTVVDRVAVAGPTAVSIGRLALLQLARGDAADLASAVPLYGRPPDITVKRKGT
jgi:tRNA threonylcarbamoyl adenosine modification protein YeaZ